MNNTTILASNGPTLSLVKGTQLSKKRKRLPFHEVEDDMVRSDLVNRRTVRLATTASAVSTTMNKPQTACDLNNNPSAVQAQGVVAAAEGLIIERPLSEPNVIELGFTTTCNHPPDSVNEVSRPPKRKPKTIQSILNFSRTSHEVTVIDSDDDDRPSSTTTPSMASIAVVENAGEATVIAASEVSNGAYCTPKQSLFSQRVKNIRDVVGQDMAKSATPPLATESQEESNTSNSKSLSHTVTEEVATPDSGVILNPAILAENRSTVSKGDTPNQEITSETARGTLSGTDTTIALLSPGAKPANLPNGVTKSQTSETGSPLDTIISDTAPVGGDLDSSDIKGIGKSEVDISASQILNDMVPCGIFHVKGEIPETKQLDLGNRLPPIANIIGDCRLESVAGSAPSQYHQSLAELVVDPNLPGVRGQVVRKFIELEDKYARTLRQQGRSPIRQKYLDLLLC